MTFPLLQTSAFFWSSTGEFVIASTIIPDAVLRQQEMAGAGE
jgi:hypothetical protein